MNLKKFFFSFFSILSIIGYGYFVFAAAPSGGYNPGQTLNPDCAPGDVDCKVVLQMTSGGVTLTDTHIGYGNASNVITGDSLFTRDETTKETKILRETEYDEVEGVTLTIPISFVSQNYTGTFSPGDLVETRFGEATGTIKSISSVTAPLQTTISEPVYSGTWSGGMLLTGEYTGGYGAYNYNIEITDINAETWAVSDESGIFTPGETITGSTSGQTAIFITHSDASGSFYVKSVSGTFTPGETITGSTSGQTAKFLNFIELSDMFTMTSPSATIVGPMGSDYYVSFSINGIYLDYTPVKTGYTLGDKVDFTVTLGNEDFNIFYIDTLTGTFPGIETRLINLTTTGQTDDGQLFYDKSILTVGAEVVFADIENGFNSVGTGVIESISGNEYAVSITSGTVSANNIIAAGEGNIFFIESVNSEPILLTETYGYQIGDNIFGMGIKGALNTWQSGSNLGFSGFNYFGGEFGLSQWVVIGGSNIYGTQITNEGVGIGALEGGNGTSITIDDIAQTINFNNNYSFPFADGAAGQVLGTDGSGQLGWVTVSGGSGISPVSINGTTLYSSGLSGTGDANGYNVFFGINAGSGATAAAFSNFFGYHAGYTAINTNDSNFFGRNAGSGVTNASNSNFFGYQAGQQATSAYNSNFFGSSAGYFATNANFSNFFGLSAGYNAAGATNSNFFGYQAGNTATNAYNSNFFGENAGSSATVAYNSNFFGENAGQNATNAAHSNFFGSSAGYDATNASNSIFIGQSAGNGDLVNNTGSLDDFSILIGPNTSTGNNGSGVGYSNSIALGGYATNTASNQLMIGSTSRPINTLVLTGASGNTCTLDVTVASPSCSSDERLKTNVEDLTNDTLDKLVQVKTVSYTWNNFPDKGAQIGFLAQDLEQYFPSLVSDAPNGFKTVSYGGMTPVLVQAIREMNLHITELSNMERPNTWRDSLIVWFGNVENGINEFFAKRVTTDELCVGTVCVTQDQFLQMVQGSGQAPVIHVAPSADPDPQPTDTPVGDTLSDQPTTEVPPPSPPSDAGTPTESADTGSLDTPSDSDTDTDSAL